jgi:hypothetical protein
MSNVTSIVPQETEDADKFPRPAQPEFENRQLNLFQTFLANNDQERDRLSNTIDLWDSVPRYSVSRQEMNNARIDGEFLRHHEVTFQHRQRTYTRTVYPARVKDVDGKYRDFYPSAGEELVEDALRKLAIDQQSGYFDKPNYRSGVVFTLHMLREEMKKRGHARSFQQIVLSLNILSGCSIEIVSHDGGESYAKAPCLPALAAVSRAKLKDDPTAKWVVQFHPLVTAAIDQVTHRQYNYALMMSHSTQLARWLHKQLVLKYTFADFGKQFETRFTTIRRDSGLLDAYGRERAAADKLEDAFKDLKKASVIHDYERRNITGPRNKLIDVVFTVKASLDFISAAKAANKRQKDAVVAAARPVAIGGGSTADNSKRR